ncbi:hypothetical protein Tco_0031186 [Tanacetum coccineum]
MGAKAISPSYAWSTAGVQIPENNLDDLHSSREEDGTSETLVPKIDWALGVSFSRAVGFLRGTSVVVACRESNAFVLVHWGHMEPQIFPSGLVDTRAKGFTDSL